MKSICRLVATFVILAAPTTIVAQLPSDGQLIRGAPTPDSVAGDIEAVNLKRQEKLAALFKDVGGTSTLRDVHEHGETGHDVLSVRNVEVVLPGKHRDRVIVVGAHLDQVAKRPNDTGSPHGLIDDWSGAVLLVKLFDHMKQQAKNGKEFNHTFVFVGFAYEESGLWGSRSYVSGLSPAELAGVKAMVNFECLGVSHLFTWDNGSTDWLEDLASAVDRKFPDVTVERRILTGVGADSVPFIDAGRPAITIDSLGPNDFSKIHTSKDRWESMSPDNYARAFTFAKEYLAELDELLSAAPNLSDDNRTLPESQFTAKFRVENRQRDLPFEPKYSSAIDRGYSAGFGARPASRDVEFFEAIRNANAKWLKAAAEGNANDLASTYVDDAVIFPDGETSRMRMGKGQIKDYYEDLFRKLNGGLKTSYSSKSLAIVGDLAFESGEYVNVGGPKLQSYVVWQAGNDGVGRNARMRLDAWTSATFPAPSAFGPDAGVGKITTPTGVTDPEIVQLPEGVFVLRCGDHRILVDTRVKPIKTIPIGAESGNELPASYKANKNKQRAPPKLPRRLEPADAGSPSMRPKLPNRWTATALMAPFTAEQLVVGRFDCDHQKNLLHAELFGLENGWLDLWITEQGSYQVLSPDERRRLGPADWRSFSNDWLGAKAEPVGTEMLFTGSFLGESVEWWKSPVPGPPAVKAVNWFWFSKDGRTPRRTMFASEVPSLPIFGSFATTYFLDFKDTGDADLTFDHRPTGGERKEANLVELLKQSSADDQHRRESLRKYAPQISYEPNAALPPDWPEEFAMTTFMTPVRANIDPLPTEVWYDFPKRRQRTRMHHAPNSDKLLEDALLLDTKGYHVQYLRDGQVKTAQTLPGIPQPDWMAKDKAVVKAVISCGTDRRSVTTGDTSRENIVVVRAPMVDERIFWTWYTEQSGRPLMFLETSAPANVGTGLALADYYDWLPGETTSDDVYCLPPGSALTRKSLDGGFMHGHSQQKTRDMLHDRANFQLPINCFNCHVGPP